MELLQTSNHKKGEDLAVEERTTGRKKTPNRTK
jgi:hypothetical protein